MSSDRRHQRTAAPGGEMTRTVDTTLPGASQEEFDRRGQPAEGELTRGWPGRVLAGLTALLLVSGLLLAAAGSNGAAMAGVEPTACAGDSDCDTFLDPSPTVHQGPANMNNSVDNCTSVANPDQLNSDGNFILTNPPLTQNDTSRAMSDGEGDACDADADNDGLPGETTVNLTLISGTDGNGNAGTGCATDPLVFLTPVPPTNAVISGGLGNDPCHVDGVVGGSASQFVTTQSTNDTSGSFYTFFSLPAGYLNPGLNLPITVDDVARVYLNGNFLQQICFGSVVTVATTDPAFFVTGENVLQIDLVNNPFNCNFTPTARAGGGDALFIEFDGTVSYAPAGTACSNPVTDPLNPDTDGDGSLDGAECEIGTSPIIATGADKPTAEQCRMLAGAATVPTDTDGDKIQDRIEVCGYGTSMSVVDSDGDGAKDQCEIASLNTVPAVNSGDQLLLAQAIIADLGGPFVWNADLNKDGANNSADQLLMAQIILSMPSC